LGPRDEPRKFSKFSLTRMAKKVAFWGKLPKIFRYNNVDRSKRNRKESDAFLDNYIIEDKYKYDKYRR